MVYSCSVLCDHKMKPLWCRGVVTSTNPSKKKRRKSRIIEKLNKY